MSLNYVEMPARSHCPINSTEHLAQLVLTLPKVTAEAPAKTGHTFMNMHSALQEKAEIGITKRVIYYQKL